MNKNITKTLQELIKIHSITGDFKQSESIINYIKDTFSQYDDAYIQIHRFNKYPSIVIGNFNGKDADLILNGHVDVVPPSEEGQFLPKIEKDKLIARGSGDMKAGIAIMLELMRDVFKSNFTDKRILLLITSDEEIGGENGASKLVEMGYNAKGVLVPDSGDNETMVIAEKGIFDIEVEVNGRSGHASRPWLGDNAIEKTYRLYTALQSLIQEDDKLKSEGNWGSSVNLTRISAGTATNVIPDSCKAYFDIRVTEAFEDMNSLYSQIEKLVRKYDAKIVDSMMGDLVYTDPRHDYIQSYASSYRAITGKEVKIEKEHGASDGRFFASKGMPLLLQRPTCSNIHSKNEWVDLDSVSQIYEVYKHFIFQNSFGK